MENKLTSQSAGMDSILIAKRTSQIKSFMHVDLIIVNAGVHRVHLDGLRSFAYYGSFDAKGNDSQNAILIRQQALGRHKKAIMHYDAACRR